MPMWWWEEIPARELGVALSEFPRALKPGVPPAGSRRPAIAGRSLLARPGPAAVPRDIDPAQRDYSSATTDPTGQSMQFNPRATSAGLQLIGRILGLGNPLVGAGLNFLGGLINMVVGPPQPPTVTDDYTSYNANADFSQPVDVADVDSGLMPGMEPARVSDIAVPGTTDAIPSDPVNSAYVTTVQESIGPDVGLVLGTEGSLRANEITPGVSVAAAQSFPDSSNPGQVATPDPIPDPLGGFI